MRKSIFLTALFALIIGITSVCDAVTPNVNIGGDLRYRYEDVKDVDSQHQVRARVNTDVVLGNGFDLTVRLNSGNNVLGSASSEDVVDRIYFTYNRVTAMIFSIGCSHT